MPETTHLMCVLMLWVISDKGSFLNFCCFPEIVIERFSSLSTSFGTERVLPMFRLDALVLLVCPEKGLKHLVEMLSNTSFLPSKIDKEEKLSSFHVHRSNREIICWFPAGIPG